MSFKQLGLIIRRVDNGYVVAYFGDQEWQKKERIFSTVDGVFAFLREELAKAHQQMMLPAPLDPGPDDGGGGDDLPF